MSKEASALLLNLLASRIDAAGAHCSDPPPPPPRKGYEEPDDDEDKDKDKDGTKKICFF